MWKLGLEVRMSGGSWIEADKNQPPVERCPQRETGILHEDVREEIWKSPDLAREEGLGFGWPSAFRRKQLQEGQGAVAPWLPWVEGLEVSYFERHESS